MHFHLTYEGPLRASGNNSNRPKDKWDLRMAFHPQLEMLWQLHPFLSSIGGEADGRGGRHEGKPIDVHGSKFRPLVRSSLKAICELQILFLRQGDPGALVSQSGDLDNRIKTLLDGLRILPA